MMSRSSTITSRQPRLAFPHPGETIREDYLKPLGLTANELAAAIETSAADLLAVVDGRARITADLALRLAGYFHSTPQFWLNLQNTYDLAKAVREAPRFEIQAARNGHFTFRLKAGNGAVLLTSERFAARENCQSGIETLKQRLEDERCLARHQSGSGQYYFTLKLGRQNLGRSAVYQSRSAMERAIGRVKRQARLAPVV